jgi:hypothetical protein
MRESAVFESLLLLSVWFLLALFPSFLRAQSMPEGVRAQKTSLFHVKYVSEGSLYIDAGRDADLEEGMKLTVIDAPPDGMINDGIRFRGYPHVAELKLVSLADSSAVCDVISASGGLQVGQLAYLTPDSVEDRHLAENAGKSRNTRSWSASLRETPSNRNRARRKSNNRF